MKYLNKLIPFIMVILSMINIIGCGSVKYVPVHNNTNIITKDTLIIKDSTRLVDSIIYVEVPKEKVMDIITQIDTSKLETSVAKSTAYVDTTSLMIIHSLENKKTALSERIVYQDRFIETEKIVYRDSLITQEIPYEVVKDKIVYPKTYWWLLGFFVITVGIIIVKIYLKIKAAK